MMFCGQGNAAGRACCVHRWRACSRTRAAACADAQAAAAARWLVDQHLGRASLPISEFLAGGRNQENWSWMPFAQSACLLAEFLTCRVSILYRAVQAIRAPGFLYAALAARTSLLAF